MKIEEYLRDKVLLLTLHTGCMLLLAGFLHATGYEAQYCLLIISFWVLTLALWLGCDFYSRKRYFHELWTMLEKMDRRYLLGELMPSSHKLEDSLYKDMIRISNKSVIERIRRIEDEHKEYQEYIESWVHEVKAPITSIDLMCENYRIRKSGEEGGAKEDMARRIRLENQKIENYVDMALYYARSDEVYKDYVIRETELREIAVVVLKRNKHYLIENKVQAKVDCKESAFTDRKWIIFILNQLVQNCTKYRREEGSVIGIYTEEYTQEEALGGDSGKGEVDCLVKHSRGVRLVVQDNGIGIKEEELSRVFEKGFTGSNGRKMERSTGMGLYLCKKLCRKLGIEIYAESKEGQGTKMILEFPVSSFYNFNDISEKGYAGNTP